MANSIDQFNYYDPLVNKDNEKMSQEWISQLSSFVDVLVDYLQPYGIFVPRITTDQRDSVQQPQNGQLIYNITLNKFQGYENGSWVNLA